MKHTPGLRTIILALLLIVTLLFLVGKEQPAAMWNEHLVLPIRVRQAFNPRKNRQRWLRRWARRQRQRPQARRACRRRSHRPEVCRGLRNSASCAVSAYRPWPTTARGNAQRVALTAPRGAKRKHRSQGRRRLEKQTRWASCDRNGVWWT
jgi:hypothetical protein